MTTTTDAALDLFVRERDPREFRFVDGAAPDVRALAEGELLVRVEKFGLSANNVTYAVLGKSDILNYFDFFPTGEPGWGRVPVWGMATVEASRHAEVAAGARMYGYFPLARYARLRPARRTPAGFEVDRGALPGAYNQYALTATDPFHLPAQEDAMLVFRPLVLTSILLDDFIADGNGWFGAESVTIASASSKTSFALAFMLARRRSGRGVVGLTSARHAAFVERLGVYSHVVTYDAIAAAPADASTVLVDVAGDARVRAAVRARVGTGLATTITVGLSHWEQVDVESSAADASATEPTVLFFAPAWLEKRRADWGAATLASTVTGAWREVMAQVDRWTDVVHAAGRDAVASTYAGIVDGRSGPEEAHVCSLWDRAFSRGS